MFFFYLLLSVYVLCLCILVSAVSAVCVCVSVVRCELVCVCACMWRVLHLPSPPPRGCLAWTTTFPGILLPYKNLQLSHLPVPSPIDLHPWASHWIPPCPPFKTPFIELQYFASYTFILWLCSKFFLGNQSIFLSLEQGKLDILLVNNGARFFLGN